MEEVLIVGGGLSGLTAAYALKKKGIKALVVEAREKCGGRIMTALAPGNKTPVEMGATWFASKHSFLMQLIGDLNLPIFRQYQKGIGVYELSGQEELHHFQIPESEEASFRVVNGTSTLIEALVGSLEQEQILLRSKVTRIEEEETHLKVTLEGGEVRKAKQVVFALPPYLALAQKIQFSPELGHNLVAVMESTHTWMGESIKFAVEYAKPFWREQGYSGAVLSQIGPIQEMYDHTNHSGTCFALKGFLFSEVAHLSKEERKKKVLQQLTKLFGPEAAQYLSYTEKVWAQDQFTSEPYTKFVLPHQNNGHAVYARPLMNGKLLWAGSEASHHYGGYMEGAVYSGLAAANRILSAE